MARPVNLCYLYNNKNSVSATAPIIMQLGNKNEYIYMEYNILITKYDYKI
jgi:hypothetical protein